MAISQFRSWADPVPRSMEIRYWNEPCTCTSQHQTLSLPSLIFETPDAVLSRRSSCFMTQVVESCIRTR